jgi:transposase
MRGRQCREESLFTYVRLEELVPKDHILRAIDRWIDFSCIEQKTRELYSSTGRPSVDPEVLIRMLVVGYLYGITSERRLCQEVQLNLAYRWFCGLRLEDRVPEHSTFTKNRYGRFGESGLFRALFEEIVRQAVAHGLVKGKHLTVDATTVQANASLDSLEPIVVAMSPECYLDEVGQRNPVSAANTANEANPAEGKLSNDTHRSQTDPDARLLSKPFQRTQLAYSDNVLMDNASRVIVDVEVTEPNLHQEGQIAGGMLERSRFVTGIEPATVAGDKAYGYGAAVRRIFEAGVMPHVAQPVQGQWNAEGIFGKGDFAYDAQRDELICPAGKRLHKRTEHARNRQSEYAARLSDCRECALKAQCTRTRYRVAHRHWDQDYLDQAQAARQTPEWRTSQRFRKFIEHLFAEAKELMGLRRARRRGLEQVREQCLMTATVQNIKRIVKALEKGLPRWSGVGLGSVGNLFRPLVALRHAPASRLAVPPMIRQFLRRYSTQYTVLQFRVTHALE